MTPEKSPCILVIEDSKTQAEILCHYLKSAGYKVIWSENAEIALEEMKKSVPDLLLSDILMPGMDGYRLCKTVRDSPEFCHIPIILVSQLSDPVDIIKGLCCGANDFIIKPVKRESILREVAQVLDDCKKNPFGKLSNAEDTLYSYNGHDYSVRSSKEDLLRILFSIYQTAILKNYELEKTTEELNEFTTHLEETVNERTQALQVTNEIVEHLLVQRTELITRIGHDLKTPLTPLYAFIPFLEKKEDDPEKKEILSLLVKEITMLKLLVERIIKLSHITIDSFTKEISSVDIYPIIQELLNSYSYQIKEKNLRVRNSIKNGTIIHISPFHATTILENLISNAITYNKNEGFIDISYGKEGKYHILLIQDTGIGLTEKQVDHVFDDFYKADESRHDHSSHGLGLAIVRRIIILYGGFVKVVSEGLGHGSTFEVWIPYQDFQVSSDVNKKKGGNNGDV